MPICTNCGESWDLDSVHEEVSARWPNHPWESPAQTAEYAYWGASPWERSRMTKPPARSHAEQDADQARYERFFNEVLADFRQRGCTALGGSACESSLAEGPRELIETITRLGGSDTDGIESELEDAEFFGLFDEED